jgi:predicted nucleic acid-binding protein
VPATERSFSLTGNELPPSRLYVDTDFLIAALIGSEPNHQRTAAFLERLVEHGLTTLYMSSLAWLEYSHHITKERVRRAWPLDIQHRYQLDRWENPEVRARYLEDRHAALARLLSHFNVEEVNLTEHIREAARLLMAEYNLKSHDAAHVATAFAAEVVDFASFDSGYRRVDGLYLWNDLIHQPPV